MSNIAPFASIVLGLFLSCCHTIQKPPNAALLESLPDKFFLTHISSWGGHTTLNYENGYLAQQEYKAVKWRGGIWKEVLAETKYFVPSEQEWRQFWQKMDLMKVWSWKKKYRPADVSEEVYDGGSWYLSMTYKGKEIDTGGENAGPKPGHPQVTLVGWDDWHQPLQEAVSLLTHEK